MPRPTRAKSHDSAARRAAHIIAVAIAGLTAAPAFSLAQVYTLSPEARVTLAHSVPLSRTPATYRVFDGGDAIVLTLSLTNRAASTLVVSQAALLRDLSMTMTGSGPAPLNIAWTLSAEMNGGPAVP